MEIKTIKTKVYGSGFSLVDTDLLNQLQIDFKEAIEALEVMCQIYKNQQMVMIIEKAYGEKWEDIRREN